MQSLYKDLTETEHLLDAVRRFLDIISCAKRAQAQIIEAPIILKEGVMIKRAQVSSAIESLPLLSICAPCTDVAIIVVDGTLVAHSK